jgi:hypothetical protein
MTRWLQAATADLCQTDRTDRTDETPGESTNSEVLSVLSVRQFDAELFPAAHTAAPWSGRGHPPEVIRTGVADAFTDWKAMNDPQDTRAWA